jgi:uncharacterized protein involved in outer membrane biogenesis
MARRIALVLLSFLVIVVVAAGGLLAWVAWFPNTLKPSLERFLTAQVGQPVRIEGPLDVDLGRVTTVELQGLRVAAPGWAQADDLAALERLRVGVDLWAYVQDGAIRLTDLVLERPRVALERDAQGQTSWPSDPGAPQPPDAGQPDDTPLPTIESLTVTDGHVAYRDAVAEVDVEAAIASMAPAGEESAGLTIDGEGTVRGEPLDLALQVGSPELLAQSEAPLPVRGEVTLAGTRATLDGQVRDPKSLAGITLAFDLASENPRQLLALAGRPVDEALPPLTASARLTRPEEVFRLEELRADWGESRVEGDLSYDPRPERPTLTGELRAPQLNLVPLWPALTGGAPSEPPTGENPLAALSGYDADVRLATGEVRLPQLTLRETEAHVRLGPGGLTIDSLRVAAPEGQLAGRVATGPVDQQPLTAEVALNAEGINLAQAVPGDAEVTGIVNGELSGTIRGTALDTILNESQLRFEGRAEGVQLPSVQVEEVVATARLDGGRLTVDPFRAVLPEGRVAGQVTAGPFGEGFTADAALDIQEVDLAELVPGDDGIAGVLTAKLDATLNGNTATELLTRSVVQLDGEVDGLTLPQLGERVPSATLNASLQPDREQPLRVVAEGQVGGTPLRLAVTGGAAGDLARNEGQYPLTLEAALGNTTATANGSVTLPIAQGRFSADVLVEGPDPAPVLASFELPEMQLPPYRIEGAVSGEGTSYRLADLDARIGDSRMNGNLTLALDGPRPSVSGELRAPLLDADDFGGLVGSQPGTGAGETASAAQTEEAAEEAQDGDVIPQERIEPSRWQKIDLDLRLSADEVSAGPVPFDSFEVAVLLEDGLLRLEPLVLRAGEGSVEGQVELDAGQAPVTANVDLDISRIPVGRLLNRAGVDVTSFGELSGRARGDVGVGGTGMGIQEILGNSDGEVTLLMQGGSIDRTIVAALGFDLLRLFGSVVDITSERVELRCTLADLAIRDGIVNTRSLVVDTPIADIGGEGTINLETEEIDITLLARPDETPLPTDRTGISITGTLADPEINVNPVALAARGAAAATLGVLLKPFTTLADAVAGDEENTEAPCGALLEQSAAEDSG